MKTSVTGEFDIKDVSFVKLLRKYIVNVCKIIWPPKNLFVSWDFPLTNYLPEEYMSRAQFR